MLDKDDSTLSWNNNQVNMSNEVLRLFDRLFEDLNDVLDRQETWMETQDQLLANLHRGVPNVRKARA